MRTNLEARRAITAVVQELIDQRISVHPLLLQKEDISELRKSLRLTKEYQEVKGQPLAYRWWNQAVRRILDLTPGGHPKTTRIVVVGDHKVMDSMREWAEKQGLSVSKTRPEQAL